MTNNMDVVAQVQQLQDENQALKAKLREIYSLCLPIAYHMQGAVESCEPQPVAKPTQTLWGKDAGVEGAKKTLQKKVRIRTFNGLGVTDEITAAQAAGVPADEISEIVDETQAKADRSRGELFHLVIDAIWNGKNTSRDIKEAIARGRSVTQAVLRRMRQKGMVTSKGGHQKCLTWHLNLDHPMVRERLDG